MIYSDLKLGDLMLSENIKRQIEREQYSLMTNFAEAIPDLVAKLKDTEASPQQHKRDLETLITQVQYVNKYLVNAAAINYMDFNPGAEA